MPTPIQYAALGDSYTAAPYVISTDLAGGCLRSEHNYPTLLADALGADLTDVSCGSATSDHVFTPQRPLAGEPVPPQINAVTRSTDLVTVGLGGNDGGLFERLVQECPITGPSGERFGRTGECGRIDPGDLDALFANTEKKLTRVLRQVRSRAPEAHVVLVGYARLLGDRPCRILPVDPADLPGATGIAVRLRDAQRDAARAADVDFLDMHALSKGHDACSDEPWVQGVNTDRQQGAAMHPTPAGQKAVAEELADHLTEAGL